MSRSGYTDDCDDPLQAGRWRRNVTQAISGKRGQQFLREALAALDAMPEKALAADSLVTADGEYCTLGVVGAARQADMSKLDPEHTHAVADFFGIANAMVCEIVYYNDEDGGRWEEYPGPVRSWECRSSYFVPETPAERWTRMRAWVADHIKGSANSL